MPGRRVQLKAGVLALDRRQETTKGTYIEAGEILTLKAYPAEGDLLVEVEWQGNVLEVFADDLLAHAETLEPPL
jgi:hypothetical protein